MILFAYYWVFFLSNLSPSLPPSVPVTTFLLLSLSACLPPSGWLFVPVTLTCLSVCDSLTGSSGVIFRWTVALNIKGLGGFSDFVLSLCVFIGCLSCHVIDFQKSSKKDLFLWNLSSWPSWPSWRQVWTGLVDIFDSNLMFRLSLFPVKWFCWSPVFQVYFAECKYHCSSETMDLSNVFIHGSSLLLNQM